MTTAHTHSHEPCSLGRASRYLSSAPDFDLDFDFVLFQTGLSLRFRVTGTSDTFVLLSFFVACYCRRADFYAMPAGIFYEIKITTRPRRHQKLVSNEVSPAGQVLYAKSVKRRKVLSLEAHGVQSSPQEVVNSRVDGPDRRVAGPIAAVTVTSK